MNPEQETWPDPEQPEQRQDDVPEPEFALDRGGRLKKAPTAFRTISEVADDLHVPQHVLRFWETRFPQVKPLKRGGGRRYYRPEDVVLLRRIADLLYIQGYTIKGVQRLLVEGDGTLQGELPPPDVADRDEEAIHIPPHDPARDPGSMLAQAAPPEDTRTPAPEESFAAEQAAVAMAEVRALRQLLREVLTELEAMRRQLPF
jgi:DNA-binding transcriptional MerR regulator